MSSLTPFSLSFIILALFFSIINAVSDEDKPEATVTRLTNGILPEHEYNELINCNSFGEDAYFLFYCANQALVYILPFDTFYKIDFVPTYDYFTTQARAKYYQENNSLILAFQRDTWIAFFKFEANNSTTTTTKIVQFDLAFEREIIDFFIWREIVFLKGPQGYYFLTEIKRIFESNSSLIQGRYCGMIDSIRTANSPKQERLAIVNNKVIFFSFEDRSIVVNTLSNDASSIRGAVYLIKPAELHPECKTSMDISSNPDGNLISINCGKGLMSFIYNIDPFILVEIMENSELGSREIRFQNRLTGFLTSPTLAKETGLSAELYYAADTFLDGFGLRITWNRFYSLLEPSRMISSRPKIYSIIDFQGDMFAILQNKTNDEFTFFLAAKLNMTHRGFSLRFPTQGFPIDPKFIQLDNNSCLSNNHSFCFPFNCSRKENLNHTRESTIRTNETETSQPAFDRCIDNYWNITCSIPSFDHADVKNKSHATSKTIEQICRELSNDPKQQRTKYCLHDEFQMSCKKNQNLFISASYDAICRPKITDITFTGSIKVTQVEYNGVLPRRCRFVFDTDPDQYILMAFDQLDYRVVAGTSGFLSVKVQSHSQREKITVEPAETENVFTFLAPGNYLEVEYSDIRSFKFIMIKMPMSKEALQQFECLGCLLPRKACYPTINGNCATLRHDTPAWSSEQGCYWAHDRIGEKFSLPFQAKTSFLSCPHAANTNFCSTRQSSNQNWEILLNAGGYIFPLCRQVFILIDTDAVEIQVEIHTYEVLYVKANNKTVIFSKNNPTEKNLTLLVKANETSHDNNLNIEVVFFTMDPVSTNRHLANKPKIFLRVADSFTTLAIKTAFNLLLFSLKLFILLVVIYLCVYCVHRRRRTRLETSQLELEDVQNPYAKLGFKNKHELFLHLSQKEILELETMGITIDRSGNKVDKAEAECAVCLEKVESRPHQLYLCGRHYVHIDCFKEWLDKGREQGSMELCPMRCGTVALEPEMPAQSENQEATGNNSLISL